VKAVQPARRRQEVFRKVRRQQHLEHPLVEIREQVPRFAERSRADSSAPRPWLGVEILELRPAEHAQAFRVEQAHRNVWRVLRREFDYLCRGPGRNPRGADNSQLQRSLTAVVRELEGRLGERWNQPVSAALRRALPARRSTRPVGGGRKIPPAVGAGRCL
jgi:hypothetical protein